MNKELREYLSEADTDLILLDGFDDAIVGLAERYCMCDVIAYDKNKIIQIMMDRDNISYEDAQEDYKFNILGAHVGEKTPVIVDFLICKINK